MASIVAFAPTGVIDKALFNFDAMGGSLSDFKLSGTINVSVSDAFTYANYLASVNLGIPISASAYTSLTSGAANWSATQLSNIQTILTSYSAFANVHFAGVVNDSGYTPANVGTSSDINISMIYRTDLAFSGESSINQNTFGYAGSQLDVVLNVNGFGSSGLNNNYTLDSTSYGYHTLMHEIGHSLGLSHPHSSITNGVTNLTADYQATFNVGFQKLGFAINTPADMNKEYFTVMSYDDEVPPNGVDTFAQTPMILDVIALSDVYGIGVGTSGSGNDIIAPGGTGGVSSFRTYFDTGGINTIDLVNYGSSGAYLHMGTSITGAAYLVGVSMSISDFGLVGNHQNPASLRWFYGSFQNASGTTGNDTIIGNDLNNIINGISGADAIDGAGGTNTLVLSCSHSSCTSAVVLSDGVTDIIRSSLGIDTIKNIQEVQFSDASYAIADLLNLYATPTISPATTFSIPITSIQSIGISPDGHYLLIKIAGITQSVATGSSLNFNGSTVTTTDLTNTITPTPVFHSSGGTNGYALPDSYTGPASLGLKWQLIESADNAVVTGSSDNDFIKVSSANSVGKAVNGGGGSDVIDGGFGSTFVTGGANHSDTFFLDGRAPGTSWSTITDFKAGIDKATIWGFVKGVSSIDTSFTNYNNEGAAGYQGLTLHFKNLLPDGQTNGSNANLNSITFSGHTLAELGAYSLADLNTQINNGTNAHILVGSTQDTSGTHSYLYIH